LKPALQAKQELAFEGGHGAGTASAAAESSLPVQVRSIEGAGRREVPRLLVQARRHGTKLGYLARGHIFPWKLAANPAEQGTTARSDLFGVNLQQGR